METIMQGTENIVKWLAGFYDAEGCVRIKKCCRSKHTSYTPSIIINNTNIEVMDFIDTFLNEVGINTYVRCIKPIGNRKLTKYIEINRMSDIIQFVDLIVHYSINKYNELLLIKEFSMSRTERLRELTTKNNQLYYNDNEVDIFNKIKIYKAHKKGEACLTYKQVICDVPNEVTWEWLAGYIDGDGSFNLNSGGTLAFCLGTTNCNTSSKLKKFFDSCEIEYNYYDTFSTKNHLPCCEMRMYKYFVSNLDSLLVIARNIESFVIMKKRTVILAIEYATLRLSNKGKRRTTYEKDFIHIFKHNITDPSETTRETGNRRHSPTLVETLGSREKSLLAH